MHSCEPFNDSYWICLDCGDLFDRQPPCEGCVEDPALVFHTCEFESALVEGDCKPDPLLQHEELGG